MSPKHRAPRAALALTSSSESCIDSALPRHPPTKAAPSRSRRERRHRLRDTGAVKSESTSPDLVELVRRAFEHSSDRDVNALMSVYGPDSVFDTSPLGLGVDEGQAAIRGFFEDWIGTFEEFQMEPEEILDLGGGVTLAVALQSGRPVGGGAQVQWRYAAVSIWIDGVAARTTNYFDIDEARVAAERLADSRG